MSTTSSFKLTAAKRSTGISPQMHRRLKLVKKIDDQIALAKALANGGTYTTSRFRTVKDEDGGSRSVEVQKNVRPWWFPKDTGKISVSIRYSARVGKLAKCKSAFEVANGDDLLRALSTVRKAVEAGDLDAQIEASCIKLREGLKK